jgi:hypothetical protein
MLVSIGGPRPEADVRQQCTPTTASNVERLFGVNIVPRECHVAAQSVDLGTLCG